MPITTFTTLIPGGGQDRPSVRLRHHVARELGGDGRDAQVHLQDGRGLRCQVGLKSPARLYSPPVSGLR